MRAPMQHTVNGCYGGGKLMAFPTNPSNGDIHVEDGEFYVYDSSFQKQTTTGAWRRNESERLTTYYLKQALVDIHNLKARVSALESS